MLRRIADSQKYGKPVYATEVGCGTYEGAARCGGNMAEQFGTQPYSQLEQALKK